MEEFRTGLADAWTSVATFVPKFIAFLAILVIGYFVAKAIEKIVDRVLERVGFDRWVERGGIKRALAQSNYDASSLLAKVAFYVLLLFVVQMAFGIWGPNPVSNMIQGVVSYLPNIFAAILIVVVGAAIAAGVKDIVEGSLGGLSYGRGLALGASTAILVITVFAALDQLNIAENIVNGLFYAMLAVIVGAAVVAIGGGGIRTMSRYWERFADRAEERAGEIRVESRGSEERIRVRAEARKTQPDPATRPTGVATSAAPSPTQPGSRGSR